MTYDDAKNAHTLAKADELVHDDVGQSCDNLGEPVHFLPRDPKAVR